MKQITAEGGKRVNAYSVCIPTGNNDIEDTINGFLLNLDKSIDVFAAKVRNDTNLKYVWNVQTLTYPWLLSLASSPSWLSALLTSYSILMCTQLR